jgi:hypothetical protein
MNRPTGILWRAAVWMTAALILLGFYGFVRLPRLPADERTALAAQFKFERLPLPEVGGPPRNRDNVRPINPSYYRLASWVSAIGAAAAVADIDGDGLPNDVCLVDPRYDKVLVAPLPGTGRRFASFLLDPAPLPYDPATMVPTGCLAGDFNEDGATDLLVYYWGRAPVLFLRRTDAQGAPLGALTAASFRPVELVAGPRIWNTSAVTQADLDGDGHVDLVVCNYFQDGAAVFDVNGRRPERMHDSMSRAANGGGKHIFRWTGAAAGAEPAARFTEVTGLLPPRVWGGWTLAVAAGDLDGDLLPEIYFANDFGPDRLLHNESRPGQLRFRLIEGQRTWTMPASKVLGHDSFKGMGVDFGDIDGDGLMDIFVSNIANQLALEESHFAFINTGELDEMRRGRAPFVDRSEELGLARSGFSWDAKLADFNNGGALQALQADGFLRGTVNRWPELQELAMANDRLLTFTSSWPQFRPGDDISGNLHNPFFVRAASGRYFDLAPDIGLGESHVSRGIAIADVDGDGGLDFVLANQWEPSWFFHNVSPGRGAFLALHLLLPVGAEAETATATQVRDGASTAGLRGRPAIGAAARAHLADGRVLVAQVESGNGHSGHRSPDLHFGLGRADPRAAVPVEIHWRDTHGGLHRQTLRLMPGWHTVLLGQDGRES